MPHRPRPLLARAAIGRRHPGAMLRTLAMAIATVLPATVLGATIADRADPPPTAAAPTGSWPAARDSTTALATDPAPAITGVAQDPAGRRWFRADIAGSGSVGVEARSGAAAAGYTIGLLGGSGWWLPNGETGTSWIPLAWSAGATDVTLSRDMAGAAGPTAGRGVLTVFADADPPTASIEPLTVEQGELTLRWSDTDGPGSGIVTRAVRIEEAVATATGCGVFELSGGITLGQGTYDQGVLSLGPPPTSGCLRVSLVLTDLVGHTSIVAAPPYRIEPASVEPAKAPVAPKWSGRYNLYRAGTFVTQKTFTWCVAASVQMMVNIVRHHTDRTTRTQAKLIEYAQRWDEGPYGEEGGTDVTGWTRTLRHFGAGQYRAVGSATAGGALRIAATAMRQTGRPAGILVMEGRHAWVLHGFESRTDPRRDPRAWIRAVRVSGPLYPIQQKNGYDQRPNTRLSVKALARWFLPTSIGALAGKYVVVIPTH